MRYNLNYDPRNVVVLYHASCNDGFTAAWAAWLQFGDSAKYYPVSHGGKLISMKKLKGKNVFIVDFSYSRSVIDQIVRTARSLLILDHHKTSEKELAGLGCTIFDLTRSGAGITWDYFHGSGNRPNIIKYAEDYDLWQYKFEETAPVVAVMENADNSFEEWDHIRTQLDDETTRLDYINMGNTIINYRDKVIQRKFVTKPMHVMIDGMIVKAANSAIWQSEIGNALSRGEYGFSVVWSHSESGKVFYSLRSDNKIGADVEKIARLFGGGGHKNAAGFAMDEPPIIIPIGEYKCC